MKKIALIQINCSEDHSERILPLGILAVGSALKRAGYYPELININETEIEETVSSIVSGDFLYVGLSVMTGVQTQYSAELSKKIKAQSQLPVVWGGIHPSLLPEQCLQEDYIDYVVISEGEISIVELTEKIINKELPVEVAGVGYRDEKEIIINEWRPFIQDLDKYRLDFSLLDLSKFIFPLGRFKRVIAYKASRGCPFNCAFCYNNAFNKNRWRTWPIEAVVADIEYIKKNYQIDAIKFYDDNFFVDKNRAFAILERIKLPSHLEIRIDSISDDLAQKLKQYQVFDMLIGVESGSNRLLKLINKNFTTDRIIAGVEVLAKYKLPASYSAIVGLPTETKEEFESTIDLFYKIHQIHPEAVFTLGAYLPYPGSKMYEFAIEKGFQPPVKTEDWGKIDRFRKDFSSPWVNAQIVWRIREYFKMLNWKLGPIIKLFRWRIKNRIFILPIDIYVVEYLAGIALSEKGFIGKTMRKIYNKLKNRSK